MRTNHHATPRTYIAWDGEGETRHTPNCDQHYKCRCPHYYCLLAWSLGPGKPNGYMYQPDGLETHEAIDYIWTVTTKQAATPIMFSSSYDFNCLMRGLERKRAAWLWGEQPVMVGRYHVEYNKRVLTIRRERRRIEISDIWRFHQCSFVKALEKNLPDYPALDEIRSSKSRRSVFAFAAEFDSILHYCLKEIEALVLLQCKTDKDLDDAGIGKVRLNGGGSIAAKLMQINHVRKHQVRPSDANYRDVWPEAVEQAAYFAYSGGRIERWKFGYHEGPFYLYDIRSAYPRAMCDLPSLANGTWKRTRDWRHSEAFAVFQVRFNASHTARAYPYFQRVKDGSILYPERVVGWYWKPELLAASECGFDFDVSDGWSFSPDTDAQPFKFVPELFEHRMSLKAQGMQGAADVIKPGLNSLYGKMAQTVGGSPTHPPPFHQMGWAGYVTSRTRAEVFKVAMQQPNQTVFIATDGVASLKPLDVTLGDGLGEWEMSTYTRALVIEAGVYFLWNGDEVIPKYRGFDKGGIVPERIIEAWRRGDEKIDIPSTRFITLGSALAAHWSEWCKWRTIPRELDLTGNDAKREAPRIMRSKPWKELCDLAPYSVEGVTDSEPYNPKWKEIAPEKLDNVPLAVYEDESEMDSNWTGEWIGDEVA